MYGSYVGTLALDVYSTSRLINDFDGTYEQNPVVSGLLGDRPSDGELVVSALAFATLNYFIARSLPEDKRKWYLGLWAGGHGALALHNFSLYEDCEDGRASCYAYDPLKNAISGR